MWRGKKAEQSQKDKPKYCKTIKPKNPLLHVLGWWVIFNLVKMY